MNIGEFIIKIGTQGDTKGLDDAIKKMSEAEKKTRKQIKLMQDLAKATSEQEKELIKKNAAQQDELEGLKAVKSEQKALNDAMKSNIMTAVKFIGAISGTVLALDRMGNSLIKSNQLYTTFERQTGISTGRLNRLSTLAQLSGTGLSPEQVAGDLKGLQRRMFEFQLGKGAGTFAQLGINPMGMKSDDFIKALRYRLKGRRADYKSYMLDQLGLSQEWLNVIELSDEKFKQYLEDSNKLTLSAKERNKLAKLTEQQQRNNMKWELAKQKLLISIMPMVQKIMNWASDIAVKVTNFLEQNPQWLHVLKDVLILFTSAKLIGATTAIINAVKAIKGLLGIGLLSTGAKVAGKGLLGGGLLAGLIGKTGGKGLARLAATKGIGAAAGILGKRVLGFAGPIGMAVSVLWLIYDVCQAFFKKEENKEDDPAPEPAETESRYSYHNIKSTMTNNFFNNPVPASVAVDQLNNAVTRYTANQWR